MEGAVDSYWQAHYTCTQHKPCCQRREYTIKISTRESTRWYINQAVYSITQESTTLATHSVIFGEWSKLTQAI